MVAFDGLVKLFDEGKITSGDVLGTREYLKNNYLYRMGAAALGIFGNSKQEAMYPVYGVDAEGKKLTGTKRAIPSISPRENCRRLTRSGH